MWLFRHAWRRGRRKIQFETPDAQMDRVHRVLAGTPRNRIDARQQLGEREGLCQIIVRTRVKPLHPRIQIAHRGQKQDGTFITLDMRNF